MTPYKIEITWQAYNIYLVRVYTKDNKIMDCWQGKKEDIPNQLAQYFCVGDYEV